MIVHLSLMCITCIICILPKINKKLSYSTCLKFSFILICVYTAFRYDYGPDYYSYSQLFDLLKSGNPHFPVEPLFVLFMDLFPRFYLFIIVTSIFFSFSFYYLLNKYIEGRYYWLCMLFLFLEITLLLDNLIAMRSALCVYIFIFAFQFILKRKFIPYVFLIMVASVIHISSLVLLPFYFIYYLPKLSKYKKIIFFSSIVCLFIGPYLKDLIINSIFEQVESLNKYAIYQENSTMRNLNGLIFQTSLILPSYLFTNHLQKESNYTNRIIMMTCIVYIFIMLLQLDPMARLSMFFWPFYLVGITIVLKHMEDPYLKGLTGLLLLVTSCSGLINLYNSYYGVTFLKYQTIFDVQVMP